MRMNAEIYQSEDVYKPAQNAGGEQPFYNDKRGTIQHLNIEGQKLNIVFTKKGNLRGGDLHKNTQFNFIFSGKVEVTTREGINDIKTIYQTNDLIRVEPNIPHVFNFLEDTLLAEWWDGPFDAWYFKPYRSIVESQRLRS